MRSRLWAVPWLIVGIGIGSVATGMLARRMAVSWDRDTSYADRLGRIATSARRALEPRFELSRAV